MFLSIDNLNGRRAYPVLVLCGVVEVGTGGGGSVGAGDVCFEVQVDFAAFTRLHLAVVADHVVANDFVEVEDTFFLVLFQLPGILGQYI